MSIVYKRGSVFDAEAGVLVHSVNCQGVWGSGVAKEFKEKFPKAFEDYAQTCRWSQEEGHDLLGTYLRSDRDDDIRAVAVLFTSHNYGRLVDAPMSIVQATHAAVAEMLYHSTPGTHYHSPKINSGLFKVPWELTAAVIESALAVYPQISWTVWEP